MLDKMELAELLAVKICHDLSGPVGAVNNGVELLQEGSEEIQEKSIELVEASAKDAVARLLFFRQAYGATNDQAEINLSSLKSLAENFFSQRSIELDWPAADINSTVTESIKNISGKLILNIILLVSTTLIYGGTILIRLDKNIKITGSGKAVKIDQSILAVLSGDNDAKVDIKNLQAYLVQLLAEKSDYKLSLEYDDDHIEIILN